MAEEGVWSLVSASGAVVCQVGNCDKEHAETIKAQLESSQGPLKIRKGRKHQVQEVEE